MTEEIKKTPAPVDLTEPLQTRDGRPVSLLHVSLISPYPIVGVVIKADGSEMVGTWTNEGFSDRARMGGFVEHDLVNVPPEPEFLRAWVGLFRRDDGSLCVYEVEGPHVFGNWSTALGTIIGVKQVTVTEGDQDGE